MASSASSKKKPPRQPPQYREYPPRPPAEPPMVVEPMWIIKAFAVMILAALICGYLTLCLLFYQGQWQLVLHPKRTASHPATLAGAPVELLHFDPGDAATPQLTGWSIPASPGASYTHLTLLFLPAGDGSLTDAQPTLARLHEAGINLFAIDYRGYGQSAAVHPSQERMTADAEAALSYLTGTRGMPAQQIIPYGVGVGASLAAGLAAQHAILPAVILDSPAPDSLALVKADPRTKWLPVRLLLHERFPVESTLATLHTPKLLISTDTRVNPRFTAAASPKLMVELPMPRWDSLYAQSLTRFLDQYVAHGASH